MRSQERNASAASSSRRGVAEIVHSNSTVPPVAWVLAVDDQAHVLSALRRLVEAAKNLQLVGEADSGEAAVSLVSDLRPHLVLMDIHMPGMGGIGAARSIKQVSPDTLVVLLSTTHPNELASEAIESPADAIVWKGDLRTRLLDELWAQHVRGNGLDGFGPPQKTT